MTNGLREDKLMFKRVPVLMYHSIEPEGSPRVYEEEKFYNVTPEAFRKQMSYLKDNGYTPVSLDAFMKFVNMEKLDGLGDNPVLLTFDDGHISHYERALPILREFGFSGLFFLVVNDVGKKNRITWAQARLMQGAGMDIGSHSMNHKILKK
ncbi:polysaccharide deacetylase family protein, partial [Candidatus Omnitrophota bacterium]